MVEPEPADPWGDRAFPRDVQYLTDINLAARQSICSRQHQRIDLQARMLDLAAPASGETLVLQPHQPQRSSEPRPHPPRTPRSHPRPRAAAKPGQQATRTSFA